MKQQTVSNLAVTLTLARETFRSHKLSLTIVTSARLLSLAAQVYAALLTTSLIQARLQPTPDQAVPIGSLFVLMGSLLIASILEYASQAEGFRLARSFERRIRLLVILASRFSPQMEVSPIAKLKSPEVAGRLVMTIPNGVCALILAVAMLAKIAVTDPVVACILLGCGTLLIPVQRRVYRRGSADTHAMIENMAGLKRSVLAMEGRRKIPLDGDYPDMEAKLHGPSGLAALNGLFGVRMT